MSKESAYFKVDNLYGKHDVKQLKQQLDAIPGVISVSVNESEGRLAVDFDNTGTDHEKIEKRVKSLGYDISGDSGKEHVM